MKRNRFTAFLLALVLSVSLSVPALAAGDFPDVAGAEWDWAREAIRTCAEAGTVTGFEDGSFRPDEPVTGVQFIVMLTRTFYNDLVEAAKETNNDTWYAPNLAAAESITTERGNLLYKVTVEDKPMNRFNMAAALYNILEKENKLNDATTAKLQAVKTALKDYSNLKYNSVSYLVQVKYCHALGIITGMSDGAFHGEDTMTRAQACVVITRMIDLLNGETPVQPVTPPQPDNPAQPEQPQQPEQPAQTENGTLANGKAATVENVLEMLEQLRQEYPEGSAWGDDTRYTNCSDEAGAAFSLVAKHEKHISSAAVACGGYAAMISDRIFGHNTGSEVTEISQVRPGDIMFIYNKNGSNRHVALVTKVVAPGEPGNPNTKGYMVYTTDGNVNGGYVAWDSLIMLVGCGKNYTNNAGEYYCFATRY